MSTSREVRAAAAEAGLDVIVVDHHISEPRLPPAYAVINPNRLDESSPHGQLAAVGVAYLLVIAVNRCLREAGWYGPRRSEPELMQWLDLVALGTVCDVAPMTGVNRALVAQGLKVMARRTNPGACTNTIRKNEPAEAIIHNPTGTITSGLRTQANSDHSTGASRSNAHRSGTTTHTPQTAPSAP